MARFKDFGTGSDSSAPVEPINFRLHGEEFSCIPEIPGKTVLNLVAKTSSENPADSADAITDFFKTVLTEESSARFDALAVDPHRIVSMQTLTEVLEWLVEQYTNRPTERPEVL